MSTKTGSTRAEWLTARDDLLAREKELTRLGDELAQARRRLPRVRVDKPYAFETDRGRQTLAGLFDGRSQLIVIHFMHGPGTPRGCPGCTFAADGYAGSVAHLNAHDVTLVMVSRSPLATLEAYRRRMGWSVPWVSCGDSGFNDDFGAWWPGEPPPELQGLSVFELVNGTVFHTYTAYDRGTEALNPTWALLDRAPRGREDERFPAFPRRRGEYPGA